VETSTDNVTIGSSFYSFLPVPGKTISGNRKYFNDGSDILTQGGEFSIHPSVFTGETISSADVFNGYHAMTLFKICEN